MTKLERRCVTLVIAGVSALWDPSPLVAQSAFGLEEVLVSRTAESWTEVTVDSTRDVGTFLSVAIEPRSGAPLVSYYDAANEDLWLARYRGSGGNCGPGGSWDCLLVDSAGDVGRYNAIAVEEILYGVILLGVSFYDATNHSLKFAESVCAGWPCPVQPFTLLTGTPLDPKGLHTALALGPDHDPWITYQSLSLSGNEGVRVASFVGVATGDCGSSMDWHCETVKTGEGIGTYTAIDFDDSGRPHIAFYDPAAGYPYYAVRLGSGGNCGTANAWLCRSSFLAGHDTGRSIAIYVEPDATAHLAYVDVTAEALIYATYVGTGGNCGWSTGSMEWEYQCDIIDDDIGQVGAGRTVAIAGDVDHRPMIVYRDASSALSAPILMLAQPLLAAPAGSIPNCGPIDLFYTWVCTALDFGSDVQEEAAAVAIASNATGVAIAYHELDTYAFPAEGNLKVSWSQLLIFADGFESADTSRWSAHVP